MSDRLPFRATRAAQPYDELSPLPVSVLLDNVRSMYNVGAFFRTADAAGVECLYLGGITACPPKPGIEKTALGAEKKVAWRRCDDSPSVIALLRARKYEIAVVETSVQAIDLFDWRPRFPVCLIFGHEVEGVQSGLAAQADTHVCIPMLGVKHSLNVATAGGVAIYELLRKYRRMRETALSDAGSST